MSVICLYDVSSLGGALIYFQVLYSWSLTFPWSKQLLKPQAVCLSFTVTSHIYITILCFDFPPLSYLLFFICLFSSVHLVNVLCLRRTEEGVRFHGLESQTTVSRHLGAGNWTWTKVASALNHGAISQAHVHYFFWRLCFPLHEISPNICLLYTDDAADD